MERLRREVWFILGLENSKVSFEFDLNKVQIEERLTYALVKMISEIIKNRVENVKLTEKAPFSEEHNQLYEWRK